MPEPDDAGTMEDDEEEPQVDSAPTATPVPAPEATPVPEPDAMDAGAEPVGTLRTSLVNMDAYEPHPRYRLTSQAVPGLVAHESLFQIDKDSIFRGLMVEEWSVAPDNRTWTFKLHEGIEFHGGWGPLVPEDIFYSVREVSADDGTCGCSQIQDIFFNPDGHWIALDDVTLELDTVIPAPDVLNWLDYPASNSAWIVSKKNYETLRETLTEAEASALVVGTGPWEMEEIRLGEVWKFKAVHDHWRKTPEFANLEILTIPEESTSLANFLVGKIDIWSAAPDSLPKVAELETTKFMSLKGTGEMNFIIWQNGYTFVGTDKSWPGYDPDKPWIASDPDLDSEGWERARKVREAIGLAIDREKIVDELLGGEGFPGTSYGWNPFKAHTPESFDWPYDPERAKQLLKEAGYEDGFDIPISVAASHQVAVSEQACEAMAGMLQDVGINAELYQIGSAERGKQYKARTQEGIICQYINTFGGEPVDLHRLSYDPAMLWGVGWDHPWFTERMYTASSTFEFDERWALQLEMGQWMRDNGMGIGIYGQNTVFPLGPKLDSWEEHLSMGLAGSISALEYAPHRK